MSDNYSYGGSGGYGDDDYYGSGGYDDGKSGGKSSGSGSGGKSGGKSTGSGSGGKSGGKSGGSGEDSGGYSYSFPADYDPGVTVNADGSANKTAKKKKKSSKGGDPSCKDESGKKRH